MSYCAAVRTGPIDEWNLRYHAEEYGYPIRNDAALFERLMLEINQAGLSWLTILKKKANFQKAFDNFDIDKVAAYGEADKARLLADPGIIRNRLKIDAAIENAKRLVSIRESHGSFAAWLDASHPRDLKEWSKLFKKTFVFTGGEIVNEFLVSTGYLPGAHDDDCPVTAQIKQLLVANAHFVERSVDEVKGDQKKHGR